MSNIIMDTTSSGSSLKHELFVFSHLIKLELGKENKLRQNIILLLTKMTSEVEFPRIFL